MLIGEYRHTLDTKKRISLPSKFRKEVGKKIVITRGLDNCLFLYTEKEWKNISKQIGGLGMGQSGTRDFSRFILSGATEIEVDTAGRMLIPEHLIDFAAIKSKIVFAGVYTRIELWDEDAWDKNISQVSKSVDAMAEQLGEVGAI